MTRPVNAISRRATLRKISHPSALIAGRTPDLLRATGHQVRKHTVDSHAGRPATRGNARTTVVFLTAGWGNG